MALLLWMPGLWSFEGGGNFIFFSEMSLSEVCASSGADGLRSSMMVGLAGRKPCSKTKNYLGMKTPPAWYYRETG
jgi:hypothetical protein